MQTEFPFVAVRQKVALCADRPVLGVQVVSPLPTRFHDLDYRFEPTSGARLYDVPSDPF